MKVQTLILVAGIAISLCGCDKIGQTPGGGSDAEVKSAFEKLPLDVRVKTLMGSPAPAAQKLKRIQEEYAKDGKQVPDDIVKQLGGSHMAH